MDSATLCAMLLLVRRLKKRKTLRKELKKQRRNIMGQINQSPSLPIRGPFLLDDQEFYRKFRLSKELAHQLLVDITPHLRFTRQYIKFSAEAKVLLTLELYACGSMTEALKNEDITVSAEKKRCFASSIAEFITATTDTIVERLASKWIQFPSNDELESNRKKFLEKFGLAGIVGVIDGMHVLIRGPYGNPEIFEMAPLMHSINAQLICDADEKIISVEPLNPGSYDEAYIWLNSDIRKSIHKKYANKEFGYWIVGDDSYPLEPFLITPFYEGAQLNGRQVLYNSLLKNAHNSVKKVKRQLRARFKILSYQTLSYNPRLVSQIVTACSILHNMCKSAGLSDCFDFAPEEFLNDNNEGIKANEGERVIPISPLTGEGAIVRDTIVQTLRDIPTPQIEPFTLFDTLLT